VPPPVLPLVLLVLLVLLDEEEPVVVDPEELVVEPVDVLPLEPVTLVPPAPEELAPLDVPPPVPVVKPPELWVPLAQPQAAPATVAAATMRAVWRRTCFMSLRPPFRAARVSGADGHHRARRRR
jgi:hypothetical protein